ncbi:MAG: hydroxyphenylacetyl-CoA thioesterase PaaI [Nitrososphaerota archaeon]|nr:hydroxyphenylacetyl-CoA thioesterase PaaI [Nitrososphaerota archaeon]
MRHGDVSHSTEKLIRSDPFSKSLGVHIIRLGKGEATTSLKVTRGMLNFHGVAHGGVVFSLADAAFAAASNSHGTRALALNFDIAYRRPGLLGDTLTAVATEESRGARTALYHIGVVNQDGKVVAACHGTVFMTGEKF